MLRWFWTFFSCCVLLKWHYQVTHFHIFFCCLIFKNHLSISRNSFDLWKHYVHLFAPVHIWVRYFNSTRVSDPRTKEWGERCVCGWMCSCLCMRVFVFVFFFYSYLLEHNIPKVCIGSFIQVVFTILMWLNLTAESLLIPFKPTFLFCDHFNLFSLMCSLSVFGLIVAFWDSLNLALLSSLQISHVDIPCHLIQL